MAVPAWLKISETELISLGISSLVKITRRDNVLDLQHSDGSVTTQTYQDYTAAASALNDFAAITEAVSTGAPAIATITPSSSTAGALPRDITVTGSAFDATASIILGNYTTVATPLATTFVSSTVLTATVPNTITAGTYDVIYSDNNGQTDKFPDGLLII